MRANFLKYLILAILCWTFCWQESHSRVLNKDTESLASKLGHAQLNIHNVRGHWAQTRKEHNESISVDEQDAILFQYLIVNMLRSVQKSINLISSVIRIAGDTFAGVMSGMVKATGGLLNLASKVFLFLSNKLELAQPHTPAFLGNFSSKCAYGLKRAAPVLHYAGEACIYSGEILESLTLGLGEAVQDSFWGLEVVSNHSNVLVQFLLQIDDSNSVSIGRRLPEEYESISTADQSNMTTPHTTSKSERHLGSAHQKVNLLHPRSSEHTHAEPTTHITDPNRQYRSAIDIKLGKEWVAPGAATISVHDVQDSTHNSAHNTVHDRSREDTYSTNSAHNTHRDHYIHLNHTFNATSIVSKMQRVWSSVVNGTTTLLKQCTTNTTTVDSTHIVEPHGRVNETVMSTVLHYIHDSTQYVMYELPPLLDTYAQYTLQISYTILRTMSTLVLQLYTTLVHTQHTESSQGLFFVLALVATYILSILPFPNTRVKIVTIILFSVVVYCSFIATEQIQRTRLVQTTSVQAAHELLVQQANQRSRREHENSMYDSVYDMYSDVYGDGYKDIHDSSVDSTSSVQSDDIITNPHYEHTATQDVYSNINHNTTHHKHIKHTDTMNSTANTTNSTDTSTNTTNTDTTTTELFLFDDATYLNTLLTSLWTVHDTDVTQGLGAYISDMYGEMLNAELSNIPPSVANIRVKQFQLGRAPPLLRGVRVYRVRDHVCMRNEVYGTSTSDRSDGSGVVDSVTTNTTSDSDSSGANNSILAHESFLANLWRSIERHTTGAGVSNDTSSGSSGTTSSSDGSTSSSNSGGGTSDIGGSGSGTRTAPTLSTTTPAPTTPTTPTTSTTPSTMQRHLLSQFSASCDHLVIEMDVLYLSDALNIALTLGKELKSVVPEITATLTELSLAGQLKLQIKLTPDYPFIGAGQLSLLRAPQLGFSLSSLGGIELSSVPYAFQWVNDSMHFVLQQYTAPHYMELDLRGTICPECDQPPPQPYDLVKILHSAVGSTLQRVRAGGVKFRKLWGKVDADVRRGAAALHTLGLQLHHHYLKGVRYVQHTIDANPHYTTTAEDGTLHYSRYKTFDHVEEWDLHPDVRKTNIGVTKSSRAGRVLSSVKELWRSGRDEWNHKVGHMGTASSADASSASTGISASMRQDGDDNEDWMEGVWFT